MARIVVTDAASFDQTAILSDLHAKAGLRIVVRFRARFRLLFDHLADHPASGPRRDALGADVRIGVVAPYIVICRHSRHDDTVTVLRIIHARQDITRELHRR
jgi:plasmid stabilization system protein ParE